MILPERQLSSTSYRYGFNGKEKDQNGEWGMTAYDYGFRIYNPGIGKFLSVDPLAKGYPMLTPYQFAANMPIKFIDLDGLEPANNPDSPENQDDRNPTETVRAIFEWSGGMETFNANFDRIIAGGTTISGGGTGFRTDTEITSADEFNLYVNSAGSFELGDIGLEDVEIINFMLGSLITGEGPENIVFPTNGGFSQRMLRSDIVAGALMGWYDANEKSLKSGDAGNLVGFQEQVPFGIISAGWDVAINQTVFTMQGFTGSAQITIVPSESDIQVSIFNVTSITSGDFWKDLPWNEYPTSVVRDGNNLTPWGNVSQTFSFSIPINWEKPFKTISEYVIKQ
jgi:RHS repeat-associated protein